MEPLSTKNGFLNNKYLPTLLVETICTNLIQVHKLDMFLPARNKIRSIILLGKEVKPHMCLSLCSCYLLGFTEALSFPKDIYNGSYHGLCEGTKWDITLYYKRSWTLKQDWLHEYYNYIYKRNDADDHHLDYIYSNFGLQETLWHAGYITNSLERFPKSVFPPDFT